MYAIIESGGKQYKVEPGTAIKVEKLEAEVGSEVTFKAMMTADGGKVNVGNPYLDGFTVTGKVIAHDKAKKVIVFKYKAKTDYRKKQGHRQPFTKVEITAVGDEKAPARTAAPKVEKPAKAEKAPAKTVAKAAEKAPAKKAPAKKAAAKAPAKASEKAADAKKAE